MGAPDSLAACGCGSGCADCGDTLPDAPDCAVHYHFGMLLGVEDFRSEQGFHVGRLRRHQRALHGYGVVHGYAVSLDAAKAELKVEAGYALDPRGRDMALDAAQCLGLAAWWEKHRDDEAFTDIANKEDATFDAEVVLCHATCLSRPVPAIADPCAGDGGTGIAHSRICETPKLALRRAATAAATPTPLTYRLLRVLLGLAPVLAEGDPDHTDDDSWLAAQLTLRDQLPPEQRAAATALLWQAVLARAAAATADPLARLAENDDGCLVLAKLAGLHLYRDAEGWHVDAITPDIDTRATLLPTDVLQEMLLQPGVAGPAVASGGPRVLPGGSQRSGADVTLDFDQPLAIASIAATTFTLHSLEAGGWAAQALTGTPAYDDGQHRVTLTLSSPPDPSHLLRITVHGSGPTPLLGANFVPAGAPDAGSDGLDLSTQIAGS